MSRFATRLLIACVLITVGAFLGIEMTKSGIERIYGVQNDTMEENSTNVSVNPASIEATEEPAIPAQTNIDLATPVVSDKMIHRAADTTGQMLQTTVRGGVDLVVSIFEGLVLLQ